MLNVIKDNYPLELTVEDIDLYVRDKLGLYRIVAVGDVVHKQYESISFAKMDEDRFEDFYSRAVQACMSLVPINQEDLAIEIARFG